MLAVVADAVALAGIARAATRAPMMKSLCCMIHSFRSLTDLLPRRRSGGCNREAIRLQCLRCCARRRLRVGLIGKAELIGVTDDGDGWILYAPLEA